MFGNFFDTMTMPSMNINDTSFATLNPFDQIDFSSPSSLPALPSKSRTVTETKKSSKLKRVNNRGRFYL